MVVNVCVLGAGIIGLSTAVNLTELHIPGKNINVTLMADKFSPNTTGDGSAGLWDPHLPGDTPIDKIKMWGNATFDHMLRLAHSPDGGTVGNCLLAGVTLYRLKPGQTEPDLLPYWRHIVFNFKPLSQSEILRRYKHLDDSQHWVYSRYYNDASFKISAMALKKLCGEYDIVVNCTGLGSRDLVSDEKVKPIRGQIVKVEAPWIKHFSFVDNGSDCKTTYIVPKSEYVVLGGTHGFNESDTTPCERTRQGILDRCIEVEPSLKNAKICGDFVGLRPSRNEIRLERDVIPTRHGELKVVHNYGHGGSGVTLHWGCAQEATQLVKQIIHEQTLKSQL